VIKIKIMGFRDLNKYPAMKARYDNYKQWQDQTPAQRQASYATVTVPANRVKPVKVQGYVSPFNATGTSLVYMPARILGPTQAGAGATLAGILRDLVDEFTHATVPTGGITVGTKGYKFAKLTLTTVVSSTTRTESRITGTLYSKPTVDNVSSPFGQKTAGQNYDTVVTAIKAIAAYGTHDAANGGKNRCKFTPEG
jgi:hypothetical protein